MRIVANTDYQGYLDIPEYKTSAAIFEHTCGALLPRLPQTPTTIIKTHPKTHCQLFTLKLS